MNTRADIRKAIFDRLDWDPAGSYDAYDALNRFISDAVANLAIEAPGAFLEAREKLYTCPDVESASSGDTVAPLQATDYGSDDFAGAYRGNPWVFRTTYGALGYTGATQDWDTERAWDGRWVELTDVNTGEVYTRQIRTVWERTVLYSGEPNEDKTEPLVDGNWQEFRFSVVEPWDPTVGVGPFTWKVYAPTYTLPVEIAALKSIVARDGTNLSIPVITPGELEELEYEAVWNYNYPFVACRAAPVKLKGPVVAPEVTRSTARWLGPEPPGVFEYKVTYSWGRVSQESILPGIAKFDVGVSNFDVSSLSMGTADYGRARTRRPRWESAPSPVSSQGTVAISEVEGSPVAPTGLDIAVPNIEYLLGFLLRGEGPNVAENFTRESVSRSGITVTIYRRRVSTDFTNYTELGESISGYHVPALQLMDEPQGFFKLAEIRIDHGNNGVFTDQGTILPDYSQPLHHAGVHTEIALVPRPTTRIPLDIRYTMVPRQLTDDTDTIDVSAIGRRMIIGAAGKLMARKIGKTDAFNYFAMEYREGKEELMAVKANLAPKKQVMRIKPARARSRTNRRR